MLLDVGPRYIWAICSQSSCDSHVQHAAAHDLLLQDLKWCRKQLFNCRRLQMQMWTSKRTALCNWATVLSGILLSSRAGASSTDRTKSSAVPNMSNLQSLDPFQWLNVQVLERLRLTNKLWLWPLSRDLYRLSMSSRVLVQLPLPAV